MINHKFETQKNFATHERFQWVCVRLFFDDVSVAREHLLTGELWDRYARCHRHGAYPWEQRRASPPLRLV